MAATRHRVVRALLRKWRRLLTIDPLWAIRVELTPQADLDGTPVAATIEYRSERWAAILTIADAVPADELEHTIVHELLELSLFETYDLWVDLIQYAVTDEAVRLTLDGQMRVGTNRFINRLVPGLIRLAGGSK